MDKNSLISQYKMIKEYIILFQKITIGEGNDYTTSCLLDYNYFRNYYKMIAINLSKRKALDADPKAIQQISFAGNLEQVGSTTMFFVAEKAKEIILKFHKELLEYCECCGKNLILRVPQFYFALI